MANQSKTGIDVSALGDYFKQQAFNVFQTPGSPFEHSVPTVVNDYYRPAPTAPLPPILSNPSSPLYGGIEYQGQKPDQDYSNLFPLYRPPSEDDKYDPLGVLNKWKEGLQGLPKEEKEAWLRENQESLQGKTEEQADRIWRNQEYVKMYGLEDFYNNPYKEDRDFRFENDLASAAVAKRYGNDKNIETILGLSPQGKKELLESDYRSTSELNLEARRRSGESFNPETGKYEDKEFTWGERLSAAWSGIKNYALTGMMLGGYAGSYVLGVGSLAGTVIGLIGGVIGGSAEGIISPENFASDLTKAETQDNDAILNDIYVKDNDRKKEESSEEIANATANAHNAYSKGLITDEQINKSFDEMALGGNQETVNSLDQDVTIPHEGSIYYKAFKDTDIFKDLSTFDKLDYLVQSAVLDQKYKNGSGSRVFDQDMQNYVHDHQGFWELSWDTGKNIFIGGVANLGMTANAVSALSAYAFYGEEGLNNYLNGKDASGDGTDNDLWNNPSYWNKVDQYNTMSPSEIKKIDENQGISPYNAVVKPGEENDFWNANTFMEALRMSKFAWSMGVTYKTLGAVSNLATKAMGGAELAPGILTLESPMRAQVTNKLGAWGTVALGSGSIDMAYGLNTYDEVLKANTEKANQMHEQNIEKEAQRRIQTPEYRNLFFKYVEEENERRKEKAEKTGEKGKYIPVDVEIAWNDFYEHVKDLVKAEMEDTEILDINGVPQKNEKYQDYREQRAKDLHQAELSATNAFVIDATIEGIRMSGTQAIFKSYLFDKGTLNALKANNPYLHTRMQGNKEVLGKWATTRRVGAIMGANVWGGFYSNYYDDVTVGFAKAFGLQDYNNFLFQKYNPAAYATVIDDYVTPFTAAMTGALDAMQEKRSFIDGGIGAAGSLLSFTPNVNFLKRKERFKQAQEEAARDGGTASWLDREHLINTPLLDAISQANAARRKTLAKIKEDNRILEKNAYAFNNMAETMSALGMRAVTKNGTSMLDAEDAKDKEALAIAKDLVTLSNSPTAETMTPDKADWSRRKKISRAIGNVLRPILGLPTVKGNGDPAYQVAMQALEDAATIDQTAETRSKADRQNALIAQFLSLNDNKSITENMTNEEKVAFAKERLKKNATSLLDIIKQTDQVQKALERSASARILSPDIKDQLVSQYVMEGRYAQRHLNLESEITGEDLSNRNPVDWVNDRLRETSRDYNITARYGSLAGYNRALKTAEENLEEAKKRHKDAELETKKENNPNFSMMQNIRLKQMRNANEKATRKKVKEAENKVKEIKRDGKDLTEESFKVLTADDILRLNPDDRLKMLDEFHRNDYSVEQQKEIEKAEDKLLENQKKANKGISIQEALERVRDSAILMHRIEDSREVAKKIMKNPLAANSMVEALRENRKGAVIDYFNDKIVGEAFINSFDPKIENYTKEQVAEQVGGYSTAILRGMLRMINKEMRRGRRKIDFDDKKLDIIKDGITGVIAAREQRRGETTAIKQYAQKASKIKHKEQKTTPVIDPVTQQEGTPIVEEVTSDRELSDNDKKLVQYAMEFAVEKDIPLEELAQRVNSEEFNDYVQERNHGYNIDPNTRRAINVGIPENWATPVGGQYMSQLMQDVLENYANHKEEVKNIKQEAPTVAAHAPVENKPTEKPVEKKDENIDKEKKEKKNKEGEPSAHKTVEELLREVSNKAILDTAAIQTSDKKILELINGLLDFLDKPTVSEAARNVVKNILKNLVSKKIGSFIQIKNAIIAQLGETDTSSVEGLSNLWSKLMTTQIKPKALPEPAAAGNTAGANGNLFPNFNTLITRDWKELLPHKQWRDFAEKHNIMDFLQKFTTAWTKNYDTAHKAQVVFLFDEALDSNVQEGMRTIGETYVKNQHAPVILAVEINDSNKLVADCVENQAQLIPVQVNANTTKYYQPIGVMPGSHALDSDSAEMRASSARMTNLRDKITPRKGVQILQYNGNSGGIIQTNISRINGQAITTSDEEVNPNDVRSLTEAAADALGVKATEEEKNKYKEAQGEGNLPKLRTTNFYKALKEAFISRLFTDKSSKDGKPTVFFPRQKGTRNNKQVPIYVKAIADTYDRNTPGRLIVDMLSAFNSETSEVNAAKEIIESNSRISKLWKEFQKLKAAEGLAESEINNLIEANKTSVFKAIDRNFNVTDLTVEKGEKTGEPAQVFSVGLGVGKSQKIIQLKLDSNFDETDFVTFLKNFILDEEGKVNTVETIKGLRPSVRWQFDYKDVELANSKEKFDDSEEGKKKAEQQRIAKNNLRDLYDDGIFDVPALSLVYEPTNIEITINKKMKDIWPTVEKGEDNGPTGGMNGDSGSWKSGLLTDVDRMKLWAAVPNEAKQAISRILKASESREVVDDDHYSIDGDKNVLWARVTSIKSAINRVAGFLGRFNKRSGWALPSSEVGDSFDEFARDVYDNQKINHSNYDNSTVENWKKVEFDLKTIEARLAMNGETIVATRDSQGKGPGKIVTKGILNVTMYDNEGNKVIRQVRVAGTIDMITVDANGDFRLYDFKTHRKAKFDAETCKEDGYDIQLSSYANFLEKEWEDLGCKVVGIYIIPARVSYPTPSGLAMDGKTAIAGAEKDYKKASNNAGHQLLVKNLGEDDSKYTEFTGANYKVEEIIPLTRLTGDALTVSYEQMSPEERQAIIEVVEEQNGTGDVQQGTTEGGKGTSKVTEVAPDAEESASDDAEGSDEDAAFGGFSISETNNQEQSPLEKEITQEKIDEQNGKCGSGLII